MRDYHHPSQAPGRHPGVSLALLLLGGAALLWSCNESVIGGDKLDAGGPRPDAPAAVDLDTGPSPDLPVGTDLPTTLVLSPQSPTVTVQSGKALPNVQFTATFGGKAVNATWTLEQGAYGTVSGSGLFKPSGELGGTVKIAATVGNYSASTTITVMLQMSQNGATAANGNPGPGGFGGVGGEGIGPALSAGELAALSATPLSSATFKLLYPYDKTVWPLGLPAPLIQWAAPGSCSGEGVLLQLSGGYFQFRGTFGRPSALAAGSPLIRHPIPQNVWKAATRSAAGGTLTLRLTLLCGGKAYGPLQQTWTVARGQLRGTVYYQSYGTNLAKNYSGAKGGDGRFGGATLAIRGGSFNPSLVAGKDGGTAQCRVCHSVSGNGSRMVVQHGDNYRATSSYDLLKSYTETVYPASTVGTLGWIGLTPDGKLGLGNAAPIPGGANTGNTALYDLQSGAAIASTGLTSLVSRAGFPMFSPDGKQVAFTFYAGPGNGTIGSGDGTKLVVMDFDAASRTFSKARVVYQGTSAKKPGWPAFWPTGKALLFQLELPGNTSGEYFATRYGGRGEMHWVDLQSGTSTALDRLNGKEGGKLYLPVGPGNHADDSVLGYEPTVSPIASGGYAWVVFMSRRRYGNIATVDPWWSDPREHDLVKNVTPKKLWVAALDLNPTPGKDPSHPAFYLPGQELLAGNSRGFWVADPCKPDGKPCQGGDECCGGYCTRPTSGGALVCGKVKVGCAKELDKCTQSVECCDYPKFVCVNGRCARWSVQ